MKDIHSELIYSLEVRVPDQSPKRLDVYDRILAGLDPRNDLILVDPKIKAKHFLFQSKDGLLTLQFLGADSTTFLNNLPLENGKFYLLEKGDSLKCGRVEIKIHHEMAPIRPAKFKPQNTLQAQELLNESKEENLSALLEKAPALNHAEIPVPLDDKKNTSKIKSSTVSTKTNFALKKIPLKIYGFIFDLTLTYFILSYAIPASGLLENAQDLLFPMTEFLNKTFLVNHPELGQWKMLSLAEFFILFHLLMITLSLLLGNTPGAWLVGLHPAKKNFLGNRFKSYLYSLLNVFFLPLIIFDIPIYKGRTLKEWATFFDREIKSSGPFKLFRTTLAPALVVIFSLSPLYLKYPFSAIVVEEKLPTPKFKDVHTQFITSESSLFGVLLKTELNSQYSILPYFQQNKIGFTLYDHNSGKALIAQEEWRLKTDYALFKLRYSNPLSSLYLPNEEINNELLKTRAFHALMTSPLNFLQGVNHFGYFLGNAVLFKQQFLKDFSANESFLAMPFHEKNPFLLLTSRSEEILFWFTNREIIAFRLTVPKQTRLLEYFSQDILAGMRFNQANGDKLKTPQILETLEAFERENYQTLLTYYIYEAKKATDPKSKKDAEWKSFLKKNILQTKLALSGARIKNIEKSFDDVTNTL